MKKKRHYPDCKKLHKRVGHCLCYIEVKEHETIGQLRYKVKAMHRMIRSGRVLS